MTPTHYNQSIPPIQYMQSVMTAEEFKGFVKCNIIKYISRAELKGGVEDYRKAKVYMDWLIQYIDEGKINEDVL